MSAPARDPRATRVIAMKSGTSFDAVDAAALDLHREGGVLVATLLGTVSAPYPDANRAAIAAALPPAPTSAGEICRIDTLVGQAFADVAAGGQGAPLVSAVEALRPAGLEPPRSGARAAAVNLGGIADVTLVADGEAPQVFDTGPANALLDAYVAHTSAGAAADDTEGRLAGAGTVDEALLARLAARLPGVEVTTSDALGLAPAAKEAVAFAVLGHLSVAGLPGTVPSGTGARGPRVLGTVPTVGVS